MDKICIMLVEYCDEFVYDISILVKDCDANLDCFVGLCFEFVDVLVDGIF